MTNLTRRNFFSAAVAASTGLAALTAVSSPLHAQLVDNITDWNLAEFRHLLQSKARARQVYDVTSIGGGKFLNNIKNSLNGFHFGFGYPTDQIQVLAALHGPANLLNFDDYVWAKYRVGEWLKVDDPRTGKPATRNIFYSAQMAHFASKDPESEESMFQNTSIQVLQSRGVRFLSCHTAIEEQSRIVIERLGLSQTRDEVVRDWQAHTLPGVLVVASMVATIAVLQCEGRYSYITV